MIQLLIVAIAVGVSALTIPVEANETPTTRSTEVPVVIKEVKETKPIKKVTKETVSEPVSTKKNNAPKKVTKTYSGNKQSWMKAAGIPQSDWPYVDTLVSRESSWNPNAVNPSSGACGLAQALPCSKVGDLWNDPVVSLKWQYGYVKARYGSYAGAISFWNSNHWY